MIWTCNNCELPCQVELPKDSKEIPQQCPMGEDETNWVIKKEEEIENKIEVIITKDDELIIKSKEVPEIELIGMMDCIVMALNEDKLEILKNSLIEVPK